MVKVRKKIETRKFKIGDRVLYDNKEYLIIGYANTHLYFLESSNKITFIVNESQLILIENNMEKGTVKLSLEDAKELYNQGGNFRTIALGAYSEEELVGANLPNSWEEFCMNYPVQKEEVFIGKGCNLIKAPNYSLRGKLVDRNFLPNKETAEAVLALFQLIQLRDCYNRYWKPNWNNDESKYIIRVWKDEIICNEYTANSQVMAFKTEELRDKFYENFKDLLETAKELL